MKEDNYIKFRERNYIGSHKSLYEETLNATKKVKEKLNLYGRSLEPQ